MSASPSSAPSPRARLSPRQAGWLLSLLLLSFMAASAAPTPLYALYRQAWGFSALTLTLIFAVYAFSLLAALLTVGALSDYVGRKPVILVAMVFELLSLLLFATAGSVPVLMLARLVQGAATGAAMSALSAGLLDVDRTRGPLINSAAPMFGMASGALGSSLLVTHAPAPMQLVYGVLLLALAVQGVAAFFLPETAPRRPGALAALKPRVAVPAAARKAFWLVAPVNLAVWALGGFFLSLGPTLARQLSGLASPVMGGLLMCALTVSGAVSVIVLQHWAARPLLRLGTGALVLGLAVALGGVHLGQVALFFGGTVVAGVGFGTAFMGALRAVLPLAAPDQRATLMAAVLVLCYCAFSLPALLAGLAVGRFGLLPTTEAYAATLIVLAALAAFGMRAMPAPAALAARA